VRRNCRGLKFDDQLGTLRDLQQQGKIRGFPCSRAISRSRAARWRASPSACTRRPRRWRSPVMLPILGTSSVRHLEENVAAALLELGDQDFRDLDRG